MSPREQCWGSAHPPGDPGAGTTLDSKTHAAPSSWWMGPRLPMTCLTASPVTQAPGSPRGALSDQTLTPGPWALSLRPQSRQWGRLSQVRLRARTQAQKPFQDRGRPGLCAQAGGSHQTPALLEGSTGPAPQRPAALHSQGDFISRKSSKLRATQCPAHTAGPARPTGSGDPARVPPRPPGQKVGIQGAQCCQREPGGQRGHSQGREGRSPRPPARGLPGGRTGGLRSPCRC